jgi:phosphotransferase family enzyme
LPDALTFGVAELAPLVLRLLDEPSAELIEWRDEPLGWINLMDAALHRVSGVARVDGRTVDWSLVMKGFPRPEPEASATNLASWDYWKREINAYASGTLDSLPGGFTAPRFAGVIPRPDGALWLGLEEIAGVDPRPWPLERFEAAARSAGAFGGAYLDGFALPDADGLGPGGLRSWVELLAGVLGARSPRARRGPLATRAAPRADDLAALLADRAPLLGALDRLPQTFVHRDFTPVNLLVRATAAGADEFVAIDWAIAGAGALGEDAAGMVGASLWQLLAEPSRAKALEERVMRGYLDGLKDAGWHGDDGAVRFGYAATLALRFAPLTPVWADALDDPGKAEWFGRKFGRPPETVATAWGELQEFLLDRAAEAIRLARSLQVSRFA